MGLITDEVLVRFFVELRTTGTDIDPDDVSFGLRELCQDNGSYTRRTSATPLRYYWRNQTPFAASPTLRYPWRNQTPFAARPTLIKAHPALVEAFDAAEIVVALQAEQLMNERGK